MFDDLGLREITAIVFTSDHGYHLGDHTFWQKGNVHEEVIRVPMIVSVPGVKPGRSKSIVELVNLDPTLAELAGLRIPNSVQGSSLLPVLRDPGYSIKAGALSFAKGISWRAPSRVYIRHSDGLQEFYDIQKILAGSRISQMIHGMSKP